MSSVVGTNVYIHKEGDKFIIIAIYVDDLLLVINDPTNLL
jgi:hypothetical protein